MTMTMMLMMITDEQRLKLSFTTRADARRAGVK